MADTEGDEGTSFARENEDNHGETAINAGRRGTNDLTNVGKKIRPEGNEAVTWMLDRAVGLVFGHRDRYRNS